MKAPDENHLLSEILDGGDLDALRAASLSRGLAAVRRRRRFRRAGFLAAVMLPALVLFAPALRRHPAPVAQLAAKPTPAPAAADSGVKYINEKELLALFPNRPIALIGKPGQRQVIFLDELQPAPQSSQQ